MPKLFIRQPFTESGDEQRQILNAVFAELKQQLAAFPNIEVLTDLEAQTRDSFMARFEALTGQPFTPTTFREHRLSRLAQADGVLYLRTGLSESGAFELACHVLGEKKSPVLFCIWDKAPIKTTLLQDLQDRCPIEYVTFSQAQDLAPALAAFFRRISS